MILLKLADDSIRYFRTFAFEAGGYNIQIAHYRYRSNLTNSIQSKYSAKDYYDLDEKK